jgi:tetratricopeptide (TPR) repeat protein
MKDLLTNRFIALFSVLSLFCSPAFAQFENMVNQTHAQRYTTIRKFIVQHVMHFDSIESFKSIQKLHEVAVKAKDEDLVLESDLLLMLLKAQIKKESPRRLIRGTRVVLKNAEKANNLQIQIRARMMLRSFYWFETKNYELAFEQYLKIYPLLRKVTARDFPEKAYTLTQMAEAYYFFADFKNAVRFSREALTAEVIEDHRGVHNTARNTIGLSHIKMGRLDSADVYFQRIMDNVGINDYAVWKGIAQGDLGLTAYLRGDYAKALPLLQSNVDQALIFGDHDQAARSLTLLSDIYFKTGRIEDAETTMRQARAYVGRSGLLKPLEQLYQVFAKVYATRGNIKLTSTYLDSATQVKDQLASEFNSIQMLRATEKSQLQSHRAALQQVAAEKQIKTLERNILFILMVLLVVVLFYFYKTHYYQAREKQRIVNDQLIKAEQELTFATIQLEEFTRSISEKNLLVEELSARYGINVSDETRIELQKSTILTDEQWEYFRALFEKIHSGYLHRLREKLPGLTPAETRFMALSKLNLNYKEMASTLGISVQSVRVIRHRIRKKLNIAEEADLHDVVDTI